MSDGVTDVFFPDDPAYVFGDLGVSMFANFASFEDEEEMLTDAEIDACIEQMDAEGGGLDDLITRIFDQGQEGSCVGNAVTQGMQIIQAIQNGKANVVELSAISIYKQIGRSASSGAMVSDAFDAVRETGILPLDTPENRQRFGDQVMPHRGFKTPYPKDWKKTAALFRGVEGQVIRSVQGLFTASCKRRPIIVGRDGHSILYARPTRRSGKRAFKYANSWKPSWGDNGYGYDTTTQIKRSASWAFALKTGTVL